MISEPNNEVLGSQAAEGLSKPPKGDKGDKKQQSQKQQQKKGSDDRKGNTKSQSDNKSKGTGGDSKPNKSVNQDSSTGRIGSGDSSKSVKGAGQGSTRRQGGSSSSDTRIQPPRLALFDHLPRHRHVSKVTSIEGSPGIHPAILKLGELFLSEVIHDDDDRAQALLLAFCNVVEDYKTPPHTSLSWDLDKYVKLQVRRGHC